MKVLWLASWYPNKFEPVNGDFIQRHAKAVSQLLPIHVFHITQIGKDIETEKPLETNTNHNLTESVCYFKFKKWGIPIIDKIRYNLLYKKKAIECVEAYMNKNGKPNLIHVHVPMKAGWIAYTLFKKYNIPYIISEQASYYDDDAPDNFNSRSWFFKRTAKKVCTHAKAISNVSGKIAKKMEKNFDINKVYTIYNIADTNSFFYKPFSSTEFIWLHVSTLSEQKNVTGIIKAFYNLKKENKQKAKLILVGAKIHLHEALVNELQLEKDILFIGEVPHNKVASYMQQANAFVLFSNHENFPCVLVEALCCGLPVIASDVGGIAEAINESNGTIVSSNDISSLTNAMMNMMMNYKNYNQEQIALHAKQLYDDSIIAKQFIGLYDTCLKN